MKRTPLYSAHESAGAKLIEFGGWEMPVYYTTITEEHLAVRKAGGIFDISHMGELEVEGAGAERFLNSALTNDVSKLEPGWGQYSLMCNERGGTVDDLYVYRLGATKFLLIINASRIEADFAWLRGLPRPGAETFELRNVSDAYAAVAVQGPVVRSLIDEIIPGASRCEGAVPCSALKKNQVACYEVGGETVLVASTGYTGEDGFEIVASPGIIGSIWEKTLTVGGPRGLKPCGLGARDTLRTEVCYPLYGHELDEQTGPIEAGLGFFVRLDKGDFVGRDAIARLKTEGPPRKLAAFRLAQRAAPPRAGYELWVGAPENRCIGHVTSGTQSPSLGTGIGLGYVEPGLSKPGTVLEVDIRGRRAPVEIVPKPIYRKP